MDLIHRLFEILNSFKGFRALYKVRDPQHMLIEHNGVRYAVKFIEIKHPNENVTTDVEQLKYYFFK